MKFNKNLEELQVYETGKPIELVMRDYGLNENDIIKLASNENPLGASWKVKQALKEITNEIHLYPDDSYLDLKTALANKFEVSQENIIIGAGSDQIIEVCIHAKANDKNAILTAGVTFAMYDIYANQVGTKIYKTPSSLHNIQEFKEIYAKHKDEISIIFLCVPNNPMGECLDASEVYDFLNEVSDETLVVVDGAYQEFASYKDSKKVIKPSELIKKHKNTIYIGTFSKLYALAGMRVGYGIANTDIISSLSKLRAPFNITTLSVKAALVAINDDEFVKQSLENNATQMKRYEDFANSKNIKFIPSYTNFITFIFDEIDASSLATNLLKKGIILRDLKSYGLNAFRITIGTQEQNDRVLKELNEILK